jgi:hypothetical protein
MALNVLPETLYRTKTFECFTLKFSPLSTYYFRRRENYSLFILLITVKLVWLRFCWPVRLYATRRAEFIHFSLVVFR